MCERLYPGDDATIAWACSSLGKVYQRSGRPKDSELLHARALEVERQRFEGDSKEVATAILGLAVVRQLRGKEAEARTGVAEAIDMGRRLYPDGSIFLASLLWLLGSSRLKIGDAAAALPDLEEAERIMAGLLSDAHTDMVRLRTHVADCRAALDQ